MPRPFKLSLASDCPVDSVPVAIPSVRGDDGKPVPRGEKRQVVRFNKGDRACTYDLHAEQFKCLVSILSGDRVAGNATRFGRISARLENAKRNVVELEAMIEKYPPPHHWHDRFVNGLKAMMTAVEQLEADAVAAMPCRLGDYALILATDVVPVVPTPEPMAAPIETTSAASAPMMPPVRKE